MSNRFNRKFLLKRLNVITFAAGNILGIVAPLDVLVEDSVVGTTSEVRSISGEAAREEGSAIVRRLVEVMAGLDRAGEPVSNFLRALAFAASDHVGVGTDAPLVVEDQVASARVEGSLAPRAVQVLIAGGLALIDAVLSGTSSRRLRVLKEFSSVAVDPVRKDATHAVEDQPVLAKKGCGDGPARQ